MIGAGHNFDHLSDSDDEYFAKEVNGMKVNVYFTWNGNIIGKREVRIPKNGFYPTGKLDILHILLTCLHQFNLDF